MSESTKQISVDVECGDTTYSVTVDRATGRGDVCEVREGRSYVLGEGRWDGSSFVDCPVDLGEAYEAIDEALSEALDDEPTCPYCHCQGFEGRGGVVCGCECTDADGRPLPLGALEAVDRVVDDGVELDDPRGKCSGLGCPGQAGETCLGCVYWTSPEEGAALREAAEDAAWDREAADAAILEEEARQRADDEERPRRIAEAQKVVDTFRAEEDLAEGREAVWGAVDRVELGEADEEEVETWDAERLFNLKVLGKSGSRSLVRDEATFWVDSPDLDEDLPRTERGTEDHVSAYAAWCRAANAATPNDELVSDDEHTTIAEQVAFCVGDDGARGGDLLSELRRSLGASEERDGHGLVRWTYKDGSTIIASDGGWDLGISGADDSCWCWQAEGCRCDHDQ